MTKKIALDAGHGLKTAGKETPTGIKEWTLNDKVRDKVVEMLKDYDCEFVFPDNNEGSVDESLADRWNRYMNAGVDVVVSIHHNAYTGKWNTATGVEVWTDKGPTAKDTELAKAIYKNLPKYTGLVGRGIKAENWAIINQDRIPAVLVEGGFMDGKKDYNVIISDQGQTGYAKAVAEGLIEFLDLKKKEPKIKKVNYKMKFKQNMNIRKGPGIEYPKNTKEQVKKDYTYTIVGESMSTKNTKWGKLKSGAGWVCIEKKYCTKV